MVFRREGTSFIPVDSFGCLRIWSASHNFSLLCIMRSFVCCERVSIRNPNKIGWITMEFWCNRAQFESNQQQMNKKEMKVVFYLNAFIKLGLVICRIICANFALIQCLFSMTLGDEITYRFVFTRCCFSQIPPFARTVSTPTFGDKSLSSWNLLLFS